MGMGQEVNHGNRRALVAATRNVRELTAEWCAFVLVTCHSPGIGAAELGAYVADGIFGHCGQPPATGELFLATAEGGSCPVVVLGGGRRSVWR